MNALSAGLMFLAQETHEAPRKDLGEATWWLVGLMAVVLLAFIVAGAVIYVVRKRSLKSEATASDVPLTLADLRRMRASGEIDDDEMERLKGIVLAQARKDRPRSDKDGEGKTS